ncbi:glutathione S-transferase family protein [Pelagibacterium halotolerans]|uniref:Glutathione S-transferase n=1 Tax=Pelagibacterium halotolerans (strain DSM 22347 / JCM 15775 / CGMCC 1.7692 / B2) TaxID=1082931 RepID=G4R7B7_PELHB|nr:glutathione S-transferase family protein [Pelagibacterium halotolerans]AEQ51253.1 glutathione S-transferase [Pelagibacterium halotolerans B2]QJR18888.1 glutathione S-transferase family protein [Pelagibacterium halotolerans]SEA67195.1 glutathione S-transferase [Pelagibacterium halotolerans]
MTELVLYAAPGTCARVPCIALEEAGADYEIRLVRFMSGEHRSDGFLKLNPKGKVPTLLVGGEPLTENIAIARFLAQRFPDAELLPVYGDPLSNARVLADLSFCASTLHPTVTRIRMPDFMVDGAAAAASVRERAIAAMKPFAAVVEERVASGRWWYGANWSIVDAYIYWVWFRITGAGFPGEEFPEWAGHASRMEKRPAVRRALAHEARLQAQLEKEGLAFRPS